MIIKEIKLELKHYALKNKLQTSNYVHESRDSWIISIKDDLDKEGFGEASPISIFNNESIIESGYSFHGFKLALSGVNDEIDIEELDKVIKDKNQLKYENLSGLFFVSL